MPAVIPVNLFQFEDGFVKHAELAISVGAGNVGAESWGLLPLETNTKTTAAAAEVLFAGIARSRMSNRGRPATTPQDPA